MYAGRPPRVSYQFRTPSGTRRVRTRCGTLNRNKIQAEFDGREEVEMHRGQPSHVSLLAGGTLAFLTCLGTPPAARADDPMLAIRLGGDESAIYAVAEIDRLGFEGDTALVVEWAGGSQSYPAASIEKIEFLWQFSSAEDPREAAAFVKALHLFQNQPNPFSPETRIVFELQAAGSVELNIHSPDGRLVRTLVRGECPAGRQELRWDGLDNGRRAVASGVYFYNLTAPGVRESRRMILLP